MGKPAQSRLIGAEAKPPLQDRIDAAKDGEAVLCTPQELADLPAPVEGPESLLATVSERLEREPKCFDRDEALMHVTEAMRSLERLRLRAARVVESAAGQK